MLQSKEDSLSMMNKKILATFAIWLMIVGYGYFSRMRSIIDNKMISKITDPINQSENSKKKIDVVILLTMMRSGSSIVGSLFDMRVNVTYLYEPLYPFGKQECNGKTRQSSLAVLRNVSSCHFENLALLYQSSTRNDFISAK